MPQPDGERGPALSPSFYLPEDFTMQSTPRHVAIIMDGNRRWARARGLPGSAGHRRGAGALEALLPVVARTGIETLTLFGFAAANWRRDRIEVASLMRLAVTTLTRCIPACMRAGVQVQIIGRRDRLPPTLLNTIRETERCTAGGERRLRIALDYSAREAILAAAQTIRGRCDATTFSNRLGAGGDVDLLIRTGGESRLSDFLLWECAFAELYFLDVHWPAFEASHLVAALEWYAHRQRRFGR